MGLLDKLLFRGNKGNCNCLYAPVCGKTVPISEIPDPTFSRGLLGNGIAIIPEDGRICAPCDAKVDMMFVGGHAVSLVTDKGIEILIHVGLETVALEGKAFTVCVKTGDDVRKGDLLMKVDLDMVKAAGFNPITPMLICNSDDFSVLKINAYKDVTHSDVVIELSR